MAIAVKHKFVSAKGDGADATLVRPSNWNDSHNITMATSKILGRLTVGAGDAEELPTTPYMIGLLNTADYAALAALLGLPTTGDAKLTFKSTADTGWILANDGSIGDSLSNATTRNNLDTQALFTFFYNNFSDAICPVQTSAGGGTTRVAQGTATVAFNAHCRMVVPKLLGRALIVAGTGSGLTNRVLGTTGGEENHTLTIAEMPFHGHTFSFSGSGGGTGTGTGSGSASVSGSYSASTGTVSSDHSHAFSGTSDAMDRANPHSHPYTITAINSGTGTTINYFYSGAAAANTGNTDINHLHTFSGGTGGISANHTHGYSGTVNSSGSCTVSTINVSVAVTVSGTGAVDGNGGGVAHNTMQPWTAWSIMIRL